MRVTKLYFQRFSFICLKEKVFSKRECSFLKPACSSSNKESVIISSLFIVLEMHPFLSLFPDNFRSCFKSPFLNQDITSAAFHALPVFFDIRLVGVEILDLIFELYVVHCRSDTSVIFYEQEMRYQIFPKKDIRQRKANICLNFDVRVCIQIIIKCTVIL